MIIEYDNTKNQQNIKSRKLPFDLVAEMDFSTAVVIEDTRKDYPEDRFVFTGLIKNRLHVACVTPIEGGLRVISLRKANKREGIKYENQTAY